MRITIRTKIAGVVAAVAICALPLSDSLADIVNLTTTGASGSISGDSTGGQAFFQQVSPTIFRGTGTMDPFLTIKQNGQEAAYNTSSDLGDTFDQLRQNAWNIDVKLSDLAVVDRGGIQSYQFILDINQNNNQVGRMLSLNQLQVFLTGTPGQTGGTRDLNTGYFTPPTTPPTPWTTVYDMNPGGGTANGVSLNADLNQGSAGENMLFYLPVSAFAGKTGDYVILYSQFGHPPGDYSSNDGYEEWGYAPVPEPTTMLAGALILLPFAASAVRVIRKNRTA